MTPVRPLTSQSTKQEQTLDGNRWPAGRWRVILTQNTHLSELKTIRTYQRISLLDDRAEMQTGWVSNNIKPSPITLNQWCPNVFQGGHTWPYIWPRGPAFPLNILRLTLTTLRPEQHHLGTRPRAMCEVLSGRTLDVPLWTHVNLCRAVPSGIYTTKRQSLRSSCQGLQRSAHAQSFFAFDLHNNSRLCCDSHVRFNYNCIKTVFSRLPELSVFYWFPPSTHHHSFGFVALRAKRSDMCAARKWQWQMTQRIWRFSATTPAMNFTCARRSYRSAPANNKVWPPHPGTGTRSGDIALVCRHGWSSWSLCKENIKPLTMKVPMLISSKQTSS